MVKHVPVMGLWISLALVTFLTVINLPGALASHAHYLPYHATSAVKKAAAQLRAMRGAAESERELNGVKAKSLDPVDCGTYDENQPMWFANLCSICSVDNFAYLDHAGVYRTANKGELIAYKCEDVYCPVPQVKDCYELDNDCLSNEFCWIDQHEKWGAWAMGYQGNTFDVANCGADQLEAIMEVTDVAKRNALLASYNNQVCNSGITVATPKTAVWKPVHGQCVRYRQLQQSCIGDPLSFLNPALDPTFNRQEDGRVFERPLVCDPNGGAGGTPLVCTGPDYDVSPNTCLQSRPQDICYQGPWWDSSQCPRTTTNIQGGGLTRDQLLDPSPNANRIASTAMLLFAGEVGTPGTCEFWDQGTRLGRATESARRRLYQIMGAVWPVAGLGPVPTYAEVMAGVPNSAVTANIAACYANENGDPNNIYVQELAQMDAMTSFPNKIWSLVHVMVHNQPSPLTRERYEGFQALAAFLLENFWCDDCRGFFYGGIVSRYGMPPSTMDPDVMAKWWWWAHNVASEHTASTRAGHPWIHQFGDSATDPSISEYQNPYFMRWEDAVEEWTIDSPGAPISPSPVPAVQPVSSGSKVSCASECRSEKKACLSNCEIQKEKILMCKADCQKDYKTCKKTCP